MRLDLQTKRAAAGELGEDDPLAATDLAPMAAVETLYRGQARGLLRSLTRRAGNADDAFDLLQDAFVRILGLGGERLRHLQAQRPEAYLARTATNLLRDRAKMATRRGADRHVPADVVDLAGADPHRLLETRDLLRHLEAAILKLRPRTRAIFLAHRLDGLSYAEIAARTGLSIKGVEKQMSRAIATIDRAMERTRR